MPNEPLTFRRVSLDAALSAGVEDLLIANWEEKDPSLEQPLAVDWAQLKASERTGHYHAMGAFSRGRLVGYSAWFVYPAVRQVGKLWALNDTTYLDPAHRLGSTGTRLVKAALAMVKEAGAVYAMHGTMPHSTNGKGRASFGRLLERQGFSRVEEVYATYL